MLSSFPLDFLAKLRPLHDHCGVSPKRLGSIPCSLSKRLVNHVRDSDVTEGYAADWTVEPLRGPAQRVADETMD